MVEVDLATGLVIIEGIVITIANGLLLLTILSKSSLRTRKEMLIIAGLAGADFFYGLSSFLVSTYRLIITALNLQNEPLTAWDCLFFPPNFLLYLTSVMISVMNLLVSIDRYLAVVRPMEYCLLDVRYAYRMLGGAAIFALLSFVFLLSSNYFGLEQVYNFNRLCYVPVPFPRFYLVYQFSLVALLGCVSVVIYIGVFFAYRANVKKTHVQQTTAGASKSTTSQTDAQNRLTTTLGIITFFTTFLFIIPNTWLAISFAMNVSFPSWVAMVIRSHSVATIAVYVFRQKEIRTGMWHLLTCRKICRVT
uniref:G-protein coupled receptors family 1 profile domain-containing protein n=1 Tax=Plectus sambesii TaxID=2011161 RepID=A0A914WKD2_9BILA